MKFIKKINKIIAFTLVLFCSVACFASAADQTVIVQNTSSNPVQIGNNTWDQRLSSLQTNVQDIRSYTINMFNKFGFNSGTTFASALGLMYQEQQSINQNILALNTTLLNNNSSQSAIISAFNREFPANNPLNSPYTSKWYLRDISAKLGPTYSGDFVTFAVRFASFDDKLSHIDSDLHSVVSNSAIISSNTTTSKNLLNTYLPSIRTSLQNVEVDVDYIRPDVSTIKSNTNTLVDISNNMYASLTRTEADVNILQEFFADAETVALKNSAEPTSNQALSEFTGSGRGSVSGSDYSDMAYVSHAISDGFHSNVNMLDALQIFNPNTSNWGWFSQATYNDINPQPNRGGVLNPSDYMSLYEDLERDSMRKNFSDTPFLDSYNSETSGVIPE